MPSNKTRRSQIIPSKQLLKADIGLVEVTKNLAEGLAAIAKANLKEWRDMEVGSALIDPREQLEKAYNAEKQALEAEIALRSHPQRERSY